MLQDLSGCICITVALLPWWNIDSLAVAFTSKRDPFILQGGQVRSVTPPAKRGKWIWRCHLLLCGDFAHSPGIKIFKLTFLTKQPVIIMHCDMKGFGFLVLFGKAVACAQTTAMDPSLLALHEAEIGEVAVSVWLWSMSVWLPRRHREDERLRKHAHTSPTTPVPEGDLFIKHICNQE